MGGYPGLAEQRLLWLENKLRQALLETESLRQQVAALAQALNKLGSGQDSGGPSGLCLGVTTSAISAATFGGSDGSGTATITLPDGSTGTFTVGNRGTTGFATGKNGMFDWVESAQRWYIWGDC